MLTWGRRINSVRKTDHIASVFRFPASSGDSCLENSSLETALFGSRQPSSCFTCFVPRKKKTEKLHDPFLMSPPFSSLSLSSALRFRPRLAELIAEHSNLRRSALAPQADEHFADHYIERWCPPSHSGADRSEIIVETGDNIDNILISVQQFR